MNNNRNSAHGPLRAANIELLGERPEYSPRLPWRWIVVGALTLIAVIIGHHYQRDRELRQLREHIITTHGSRLKSLQSQVKTIQETIVTLVHKSLTQGPDLKLRDSGVSIDVFRKNRVVALVLPISRSTVSQLETRVSGSRAPTASNGNIPSSDEIEDSVTVAEVERIIAHQDRRNQGSFFSCLGVTPLRAEQVFAQKELLDDESLKDLYATDNLMRLRVLADQVERFMRRETPVVQEMVQSNYFFLLLKNENSKVSEAKAFTFLWDLSRKTLLHSQVLDVNGKLIQARLTPGNQTNSASTGDLLNGRLSAANHASRARGLDCAVAAEFRRKLNRS